MAAEKILRTAYPLYSLKTGYAAHSPNLKEADRIAGLILSRNFGKNFPKSREQVSTNDGTVTYAVMAARHSNLPASTPNWA